MQSAGMNVDHEDAPSTASVWAKRLLLIVIVLAVLAGIGYGLKSLFSGGAPHKKAMTTVKLLPDTPPPPPPPPKEPPKEQPKEAPKEMKVEPQPKPIEAPPAEQLKMEGAAGDGPSPFAAGAVNNEYQGGEVSNKIGGGPSKYQFAWYTGMIKTQIEDAFAKDKGLANGAYKIVVKIWIAANGHVQRYELTNSTGDAATDALIKKALDNIAPLAEPPPADMPQPVKLRVTARSTG